MNTLTILQNALLNSSVKQLRATEIARFRLGGHWVVTKDTNRLVEKNDVPFKDIEDNYYETINMLVYCYRDSRHRDKIWVNKKRFEEGKYPQIKICEISRVLFDTSYLDVGTIVETGQTISRTYCIDRGLVYLWIDGTLHNILEPVQTVVQGYHSITRPSWWASTQGIGMELEIYAGDAMELNKQLPADILGEKDASIDRYHGIELIGGPYTLEQYQSGKTPWNEVVTKALDMNSKGYNAGDGYGIHLSLSRSLFSTLHGAKFVVFFNQQEALCKLVAQRDVIYNGSYGKRKTIKSTTYFQGNHHRKNTYTSHLRNTAVPVTGSMKKEYNLYTDKYEPVKVDDYRYEVRIFRANLQWDRILKNVEFVDAVKEFTRNAGVVAISTPYQGTVDFLYWLGKQAGYTHLKKFLLDNASKFSDYDSRNNADFVTKTKFKLNPKTPLVLDY